MEKLSFYVVWSLCEPPRQFSCSKTNQKRFQVLIPLPLPKQLVIFGVGQWPWSETTLSAEVLVCVDVPAQTIGTLSSEVKCLSWEGDWSEDIIRAAAGRGRKGYGKIVLKPQDNISVFSSTMFQRNNLIPEQHSESDGPSTSHQKTDTITPDSSHVGSVCFAEIQVNKTDTSDSAHPAVCPTREIPSRTVISHEGRMPWSYEDLDRLPGDTNQSSTPKKKRKLSRSSQEEMSLQIRNESRQVSVCPTKRWCHNMCLCNPDTAVLIGGETSDQNCCKDSVWKLELDSDFWFPMNSSASGPVPPCVGGQTATYDPDSKVVYVYGGLKEGQSYSEVYILNTLTWKWTLVMARGNVPNLAYHSAVCYKKELFVFGGVQPSHSLGDKSCSNALYIFNPDHELWYKPIVEGNKPLPRFGHTATLLPQKPWMVIFGGQKTATYLNDLHVLDLGMMEYNAVKSANMPPLPRGFHAAVPVLDNRILISGGCSAVGALQDVHIFNLDTCMWSSVASPELSSKPCAGHSVVNLSCVIPVQSDKHTHADNTNIRCPLLVFGGSDCSGTFYNDTLRCTLEFTTGHIQATNGEDLM